MEPLQRNNISDNLESDKIVIKKISVNKFILLSIITFGLYELWWVYKSWCFFQYKDNSNIMPAVRTIFSVFYLIPLFMKIIRLSKKYEYNKDYYSGLLFVGYFIICLLARLPDPYFLISFFSFIFFIPPVKALNFAMENCDKFHVKEQKSFNVRQIFLLIIGGSLWVFLIIGLFVSNKSEKMHTITIEFKVK